MLTSFFQTPQRRGLRLLAESTLTFLAASEDCRLAVAVVNAQAEWNDRIIQSSIRGNDVGSCSRDLPILEVS